MHWNDSDVGEVDLAARSRVLSSDDLKEIERRYWETERPRAAKAARNHWERTALSLLDGSMHPLDPELRRFGVTFQVHAQFMRDTARLARNIERARQRIREGKLTPPPPEAIARTERPENFGKRPNPR
jgi:hypothetical protein